MNDEYFIEIEDLHFEDMKGKALPEAVRDRLEPWMAGGAGILARLHNRGEKPGLYDHVVITDNAIYFAVMAEEDDGLRSFKGFNSADVIAFAFIMGPGASRDYKGMPQLRIMLREGMRIRLTLADEPGGELTRRMQQLSAQHPFRRS